MKANTAKSDHTADILRAATKIFAEHGFAGARVEAIAQAAGINKAMLYYRVGDKNKLYELVILEHFTQAIQAAREAADEPGEPQVRLGRIIEALARLFTANPELPRIMAWEISSGAKNLPSSIPQFFLRLIGLVAPLARECGLDPFCTHFAIMGSLMFTSITTPLRKRVAASLPEPYSRIGLVEVQDMAGFLINLFHLGTGDKT